MGIGFIWPSIMAVGMLFLRESPRWDFRHGNIDAARTTIAKSYGVPESHPEVVREVREIQEKLMPSQQAAGNIHGMRSLPDRRWPTGQSWASQSRPCNN